MSKFRVGITADVLNSDDLPIFGKDVLSLFDDPAIEWEYMAQPTLEISHEQAARYDAICAMVTTVTANSLSGSDRRLKLIARFGVGYDSINVPACTRAGVLLTIAPDGVRRPVATSALTFVLMLAQKVLIKDRLIRAGRWSEKSNHIGTGLTGRTLGSIGIGNIGAEMFRLARPLEMRCIAHDPLADREAQVSQRVAQKLPVRIPELRSVGAVANQPLRLRDAIREVRRREIDLPHASVQPHERLRILGWRDVSRRYRLVVGP